MLRFWVLAAFLTAPLVVQAADKPITQSTMAVLADRAFVDGVKLVRDEGMTGLHIKLENEYPKAIRDHDKLRAIYLIMMDNLQTQVLEQEFPNANDPFFNHRSFASRAEKAIDMIVPDNSKRVPFIRALFQTEHAEEEKLRNDFADVAKATQ